MTTIVTKTPRIIFLAREQVFRFSITGLLPLTIHSMYFERQKVDPAKTKPLGGSLGDQLKSDASGKLVFDFFYQSDLPSTETTVEQAQKITSLIGGSKEVIVASINSQVAPEAPRGILSYFKTMIVFNAFIPPLDSFVEVEMARPVTVSTVGSSKV